MRYELASEPLARLLVMRHQANLEFPFDREHQTGAVSWKSKERPGTPQPEKQDTAYCKSSKMHSPSRICFVVLSKLYIRE